MSSVQYYLLAELGIPAGSAYYLNKQVVQLGTDPRNDVVFNMPDIGRFHVSIQWTTHGFQIVDGNSGMRTIINGKPLMPAMSRLLSHGDYIQLGQYTAFRYMIHPPPQQQPPQPIQQQQPMTVTPTPTDTSSAYLTNTSRIGCHFCFHTLDPNDPNPTMRQFLKSDNHYYHATCYEMLPVNLRPPVIPTQIHSPQPLNWVLRYPVILG